MKKIAVVQMQSSEDKQENLKKSIDFINEAASKNAQLVCFPEFQMAFSPSNRSANHLSRIAETVKGNFVLTLAAAAKRNRIGLVVTIYEKSSKPPHVYDTAVLINGRGVTTSVYRKLHLYNALGFKESAKLMPGTSIVKPDKSPVGIVGLLICYDLRFPELSRLLTIKGADALIAPSAWVAGDMKEEHWQTMVKARAIENGSYIVAPDQVGNIYCGRSMVVDPFGVVLLDMGKQEGMSIVNIDKARIRQVRRLLPLLKNRRTDIYTLSPK
ncbi:MAG: carbon-nitrogen hydrolase family protein [Nitrososphaera sp.]